MKSRRSKTPGFNGRAVARPVRPFWPDSKNSGQFGQTRPVGGVAVWPVKKKCTMSTFARVAGHGLNADRSECRPPKMAVCGRNADPNDTANYRLAV